MDQPVEILLVEDNSADMGLSNAVLAVGMLRTAYLLLFTAAR
jgi:hypothetical protein